MAALSIIIPVYKVENYLRQCLDSVINQTYADLEILLIDDGSPDFCGQICDEYVATDSRVKVVHKENEGLCSARNDGINLASGEYIAFVDSDDWVEKDYYETMMKAAQKHHSDLVMSNYSRDEGEQGTEIRYINQDGVTSDSGKIRGIQMSVLAPYYSNRKHGACFCWNKLYRRKFIQDHELYFQDVKAQEDLIYSFQTFQYADNVALVTEAGYHYRFVPDSNMSGYRPDRDLRDRKALKILYRLAKQHQVSRDVYEALYVFTIESIRPMVWCSLFNKENHMRLCNKLRKLKEILRSEPYLTALEHADIRILEPLCKPCAIFKTHSTYYFYFLYCLQVWKRKIFGIKKY